MGNQQSSSGGGSTAFAGLPKKTDYYELLGVDEQASDDQIKKAYRKRALELHPDRNFGDVERATQQFAEVQSAYEVLSDSQERAWYDSHRDAILRGDDPADSEAAPEFRNVRVMTADEIFSLIGKFSKSVPLDDSPQSFFTVLRETFERLADGECAAAEQEGLTPVTYPSFGTSRDDDQVAKEFYSAWSNFSSRLSFAWKDKWRLSDAQDRRVRRLMVKENAKLREDAVREFNDAVRSLVVFVRKRDPRHIPNTQSEAERQKVLRDSAAAQAARSRAANQAKMNDAFAIPEWAQSRGSDQHVGEFSESEEESEVEEIECVICDKSFKSEKQYEAHAKSKKHLKAVQQLQRRMKKENVSLDLDLDASLSRTPSEPVAHAEGDEADDFPVSESGVEAPMTNLEDSEPQTAAHISLSGANSDIQSEGGDSETDDDYASRDAVEARLTSVATSPLTAADATIDVSKDLVDGVDTISLQADKPGKKIGKAKAKREKKAARQAALDQDGASHQCLVCKAGFESKTTLFKHIKETGHAAPPPQQPMATKHGKHKKR